MKCLECSFESWVGQESKLLAAGYISTKAGGPKKAFFDKEAQDKIGNVQEVGQLFMQQYNSFCSDSDTRPAKKFRYKPCSLNSGQCVVLSVLLCRSRCRILTLRMPGAEKGGDSRENPEAAH